MIKINNLFIINFFFIYLTLTALFHFLNINIIKLSIFAITVSTIFILTIYVFRNVKSIPEKLTYIILFYIFFIMINLIINFGTGSISFSIKYFGILIFFVSGYIINLYSHINKMRSSRYQKIILLFILLIPSIVYLVDVLVLKQHDSSSIFLNRNNAVLFGVISSYILLLIFNSTRFYLLYIGFNIVLYKTLGAFLAGVLSSFFVYIRRITLMKFLTIFGYTILFLFLGSYIINNYDIGLIDRIKEAVNGFRVLFSLNSFERMVNISYGEMASLSGSSDLSFLFRIKHWFNIINIYLDSDFIHILFGHGNDTIKLLTKAGLRAHNDYVRLLFEMGLLYWMTFIAFNLYILKNIGISLYSLPFMIVLMYFFTENLIDNFLSMSLLYFMLGVILANKKQGLI